MTKTVLSPFCPVASSCFARETQQHPLSHFATSCIEPCTPQGGLASEEVARCWRRPSGSPRAWFAFAEFLRGSTGSRRAGRCRGSRGARCTCSARSVKKRSKNKKILSTRLTPVHKGRPLVNRTRFWGRAMVSTFLMAAIGPGGSILYALCLSTLPNLVD